MSAQAATDAPRVLFAGGGTGGHVYPAIAIADAVRRLAPQASVAFAGTRDRMEWEAVPKAGYEINPITVSALHRGQPIRNVVFPFKLSKGMYDSLRLIGEFDPDVVVGTGGFVSGPVLLAGSLRGRPLVIQEQNAYAGLTNRLMARRAERVHIAFDEARAFLPDEKCVFSGNPTRDELRHADRDEGRSFYEIPDDVRLLFVFGGSLGSQAINEALEASLDELMKDEKTYVLWQTGSRYFDRINARVPGRDRLKVMKYIDRMDLAYAACDVALCRAGAITCSELMVTGTPAILIPSPNVAEDHQTKNALSMTRHGAAITIPESEMKQRLVQEAHDLLDDRPRREAMQAAAKGNARPDAATDIARDVLEIAKAKRN